MADISAAQALTIAADAVFLSRRPPPTAPDGYYDWQVSSDPADKREGHSTVTNLVNRVQAFQAKGGFKRDSAKVDAFLDAVTNPQAVDDRKGAFATGLGILARMDPTSDLSKKLNDKVIDTLYNTVPHPPASYLGHAHSFRQADGGGNNLENPDVGRGGTRYARSVQPRAGLPRTSLPETGLIYDSLLRKKDHKNHEGGMSSMIFAFAAIVTHSLFRTDRQDITINKASSYLDLSTVYGDKQADQDKVRDKASGRGLLYPDTFFEERLSFLPPATSVLLVIFSRNHNYIANKLLKINERGTWSDPPPTDAAQRALQDEQIFQTAKLINCGHFMSIIMGDYVAGFLGSSEGCNWNMNAFDTIKTKELEVERGLGNHVSVEFNVLYRWHATISEADQKWTEDIFSSAFGGKPFDQLSPRDFGTIAKAFEGISADPSKRTFAGLKRGPDGKFSDDDLADILQSATAHPAGAFRGHGTAPVLRLIEILGMEQSRRWGVCTLNEFRKYLGLKQFETFEEWNPDPEIAGAARRLYNHIDNLELYPGLHAESTMPLTTGSRFACGYTTTRAVLGDAIALVRGDRFYTSDFTPANLTTWGFQDCQRNMSNGGMGGEVPKLLLRHLPRHYPWNSVYSLYPFFTPEHMKKSLTRQGLDKKYTFDKPVTSRVAKVLNTFTGIKTAFSDPSKFNNIYEKFGYGSMLMFDDIKQHDTDKAMVLHALYPEKDSLQQQVSWFATAIRDKIKEKSWQYPGVPGTYVDIVNDVINVVSTRVATDQICGISVKTKDNPYGLYTEQEIYRMMTTLFTVNFLCVDDTENSFSLHEAAIRGGTVIGGLTIKSLLEISPETAPNFITRTAAKIGSLIWSPKDKVSYPWLNRLVETGRPIDELVGCILGIAVGSSVNLAQASVHVVDFYLDDAQEKERKHIIQLCNSNDAESADLLCGYVCEAMRLRPQFTGLYRRAAVDVTIPQGPGLPPMEIKEGDLVWGSVKNAHLNPLEFPEPRTVNPRRPQALYNSLNGVGFHLCPGVTHSKMSITEIVKAVFKLKNVRRAPGNAGKQHRFTEIVNETETDYYIQRDGTVGAWPTSMHIVYDA